MKQDTFYQIFLSNVLIGFYEFVLIKEFLRSQTFLGKINCKILHFTFFYLDFLR